MKDKIFLESNHQDLNHKKMNNFSKWENITEVSNKIKDMFNSEKGFFACGFKIEPKKSNEKYLINDAVSLLANKSITTLLLSQDFKRNFSKGNNFSIYIAELLSLKEMMFKSIQNFNVFNHSVLGSDKMDEIGEKSATKSVISENNPYPKVYKMIRDNSSHFSFIGDFYWDTNIENLDKKSINNEFKKLMTEKVMSKDKDYLLKISMNMLDKIKVKEKVEKVEGKKINKKIVQIDKKSKNDKVYNLILEEGYEYLKMMCLFLYHAYKYSSELVKNEDVIFIKHLNNASGKNKIWILDSYNQFFARRVNNLFLQQYNLFKSYFSLSRTKICDETIAKGTYKGLNLFSDFRLNLIYRHENEETKNIENKVDKNRVLKYIYETFFYTSTNKISIKIVFKIFFKLFLKLIAVEEGVTKVDTTSLN